MKVRWFASQMRRIFGVFESIRFRAFGCESLVGGNVRVILSACRASSRFTCHSRLAGFTSAQNRCYHRRQIMDIIDHQMLMIYCRHPWVDRRWGGGERLAGSRAATESILKSWSAIFSNSLFSPLVITQLILFASWQFNTVFVLVFSF